MHVASLVMPRTFSGRAYPKTPHWFDILSFEIFVKQRMHVVQWRFFSIAKAHEYESLQLLGKRGQFCFEVPLKVTELWSLILDPGIFSFCQ